MEIQKLFISYSWTSQEHEAFVVNLATELRESGVDVILDKWDLKEGHDAHVFMEKMVTDPTISKVIIVSDKKYSEKANDREGGVGTETQIISSEMYSKIEQDKFVVVITEKDEQGKAYLPVYYRSRIFIDLAEDDTYAQNFEQLLRWVYNKPLYIKPELGKVPSFLDESSGISLQTSTLFRRAIDAIKNSKNYADGALTEYLDTFSNNLEMFRLEESRGAREFDEKVVENIDQFILSRNEVVELFIILAQYDMKNTVNKLHVFFESLIVYLDRPSGFTGSYHEWDLDNYKFIIQELFLYAIASFLKYERFDILEGLVQHRFYVDASSGRGNETMKNFGLFRHHLKSLDNRNTRLSLRRTSIMADLLKERCIGIGISFEYLMQADFLLFVVDSLQTLNGESRQEWWPETLVYKTRFAKPFELFARAESIQYFDKIKGILNISDKSNLNELIEAFKDERLYSPKYNYDRIDVAELMAFEKLCTRK